MRCVKTGCTIHCDGSYFRGDLFVECDGELILKGVPERDDGPFELRSNLLFTPDGNASAVELYDVYGRDPRYGAFNIYNFTPTDALLAFFQMGEPELYQRFKGE